MYLLTKTGNVDETREIFNLNTITQLIFQLLKVVVCPLEKDLTHDDGYHR